MSESRECFESRLAASGGGVTGHELLDAGGTLLKGGERFLKNLNYPGYDSQKFYSQFHSLNVVHFFNGR